MKDIQAVIFDMDGLIFDSERIGFKCWKEACSNKNYDMDEKFYCTLIGRNFKGVSEMLIQNYGESFPLDEIHEETEKLLTYYVDNNEMPLKLGVHELLDYLNENKYKIAVATSTIKEKALKLLDKAGIKEKVDYVIGGDEVTNSKPEPEIFLKAAKNLGVDPKKCLVLEDSGAGIEAAHRAGMKGINVPDMKIPDSEIKKRAFMICNDLLEVKEYLKNV